MDNKWQKNGFNELLKPRGTDEFYISYNPDTGAGHGFFTEIGNMMGGNFEDGEETALCKDGKFYILKGDFRKQYEALIDKGFAECFAFYLTKVDTHRSTWSSDMVGL